MPTFSDDASPAFPENAVAVLHDYRADFPFAELPRVASALESIALPATTRPRESGARGVVAARRDLLGLLRDPAFAATHERLLDDDGTGVYDRIAAGEFGNALSAIARLGTAKAFVDGAALDRALRTSPLPFTFEVTIPASFEIDPDTGIKIKIPARTVEVSRTLAGYAGPALGAAQRAALVRYAELVGGGPERALRLGLLRAECHLGRGAPHDAMEEYLALLRAGTLGSAERRFVAIRAAMTSVELGDRAFRRSRRLDDDQRAFATAQYDKAAAIVDEHGVPTANPLRAEVVDAAERRKAQLAGNFNALGFRDSFVPVQTIEFLEGHVRDTIAKAADAADRFEQYLGKANSLEDVEAELRLELAVADANVAIAQDRRSIAAEHVARARNQIRAIESQQDFLGTATVFGGLESLFQSAGASGFGAIFGIGSTLVGFNARAEELRLQHAAAEHDLDIAGLEQSIAGLELGIAERRREFIDSRLEVTGGRFLGKDLYYRLARLFRGLAESQIQHAVLFAYLYERAVAYFLGIPAIRPVQFDHLDRAGTVLAAAALLRADVDEVTDEFANPVLPKLDDFVDRISLRQAFPIEFARLQQEGQTDFVLSLYDFDKRRPGSWQARLVRADVVLRGLVPPTVTGELTHMGRFVVRDLRATMDPGVTRLLPTAAEVDEALARQARGEAVTASVGGVLAFDLGPDTRNIDAEPRPAPTPTTRPFARELIEDYGPAGLWRLGLRGMDLRNLTDVELHLDLRSFETDIFGLQPKVAALIEQFEEEQERAVGDTLDRIVVVSLRERDPDAVADLGSRTATVPLRDGDVPDVPDPRVKVVVSLALDADGRGVPGVDLEIAKPDAGFTLARTTLANGFSEDLAVPLAYLEPEQRFPATGDWRVGLAGPAGADALHDVRLLVVCERTPR